MIIEVAAKKNKTMKWHRAQTKDWICSCIDGAEQTQKNTTPKERKKSMAHVADAAHFFFMTIQSNMIFVLLMLICVRVIGNLIFFFGCC